METKFCKFCNCEHPLTSEFWNKLSNSSPQCKERAHQLSKKWREEHRDIALQRSKKWREENKERHLENSKNYYNSNKEHCKQIRKERNSRPEQKEKRRNYQKLKYTENYNVIRKYRNNYEKNRKQTDINFRLGIVLRKRLRSALRTNTKKTGSAVRDLGISISEFKSYLEGKFKDGMTWENHGSVWHIDHIRPLASFDLTDPEQLKQAVHYSNLQPLDAFDNLSKGAKWEYNSEKGV